MAGPELLAEVDVVGVDGVERVSVRRVRWGGDVRRCPEVGIAEVGGKVHLAPEQRKDEGEPREAQQGQRQAPGHAVRDPLRHAAVILAAASCAGPKRASPQTQRRPASTQRRSAEAEAVPAPQRARAISATRRYESHESYESQGCFLRVEVYFMR